MAGVPKARWTEPIFQAVAVCVEKWGGGCVSVEGGERVVYITVGTGVRLGKSLR